MLFSTIFTVIYPVAHFSMKNKKCIHTKVNVMNIKLNICNSNLHNSNFLNLKLNLISLLPGDSPPSPHHMTFIPKQFQLSFFYFVLYRLQLELLFNCLIPYFIFWSSVVTLELQNLKEQIAGNFRYHKAFNCLCSNKTLLSN